MARARRDRRLVAVDCYDPETGQVYRETIVHCGRRFVPWEHRHRNNKSTFYSSPFGAASLTNIVLRNIVRHAGALTPDVLRQTPQHFVEMIWKAVRREGKETLHIWKTFVNAGVVDGAAFAHFACSGTLRMPLVQYFVDLRSSSMAWLVDLELCDLTCSAMELKTLACLDNLETLLIRYTRQVAATDDGFNDSVIEKLAFRALWEGKLQHLKMMFVQNGQGVTDAAFSFLSQFRALDVFCVSGTSIRAKRNAAEHHGWKREDRLEVTVRSSDHAEHTRAYTSRPRTYSLYGPVKSYTQQRHSQDVRGLPVLGCILGTPNTTAPTNQSSGNELVFGRAWSASFQVSDRSGAKGTENEPTSDHGLPNKKRRLAPKVRESKVINLERMLDGL